MAKPSRITLPPSAAFTIWTEHEDAPFFATLTVLRVMVSGRHVQCRLGDNDEIVCDVRNAVNFRKGMFLHGACPRPEIGERAWRYDGPLPRRSGKW